MKILKKLINKRNDNTITFGGEVISSSTEYIGLNKLLNIPAIYSAIELIANTVASLDIKLFSEDNTGVEELKTDKRLYCFNDEPNFYMTGVDLKKAIIRDYLIYGNAYIYIDRLDGELKLKYVPCERINCLVDDTDILNRQVYIDINGEKYHPHQFIILTKNTLDGVTGKGVIDECQNLLKLAYRQDIFTYDMLKRGGIKRGVVTLGNTADDESLKELYKNFEAMYNGKKNTVVLNKDVQYTELQQSSQEMELVDLRSSITKEVMLFFDIPENLFNNNIPTEMWQMFIKSAINPILSKIEQALNKSLLKIEEKGKLYFAFDTKQLMKGDINARFKAYEIAIKNGFMTRNEVRFEEDLRELDGLDTIPLNLGEVLLNPQTGEIYTPNTGEKVNINDLKKDEVIDNGYRD